MIHQDAHRKDQMTHPASLRPEGVGSPPPKLSQWIAMTSKLWYSSWGSGIGGVNAFLLSEVKSRFKRCGLKWPHILGFRLNIIRAHRSPRESLSLKMTFSIPWVQLVVWLTLGTSSMVGSAWSSEAKWYSGKTSRAWGWKVLVLTVPLTGVVLGKCWIPWVSISLPRKWGRARLGDSQGFF